MAMNLRLRPEAEEALRAEALRTHRSQQDVLREAVDRYLGLGPTRSPTEPESSASPSGVHDLVAAGQVRPPRTVYRRVEPTSELPAQQSSLELLDRGDRL
jgi:hypothetical protein